MASVKSSLWPVASPEAELLGFDGVQSGYLKESRLLNARFSFAVTLRALLGETQIHGAILRNVDGLHPRVVQAKRATIDIEEVLALESPEADVAAVAIHEHHNILIATEVVQPTDLVALINETQLGNFLAGGILNQKLVALILFLLLVDVDQFLFHHYGES